MVAFMSAHICARVCMHAYVNVYIYNSHACMYMYVCICVYMCTGASRCMYLCMFICMCGRIIMCLCACMFVRSVVPLLLLIRKFSYAG